MIPSFGVVFQTRCQCTKSWWNCLPEVLDFSKGAIRSFVICQGLCYLASDKKLYKSQLELMGRPVVLLKHITVSTTLEARKTLLLEHRGRGVVSKTFSRDLRWAVTQSDEPLTLSSQLIKPERKSVTYFTLFPLNLPWENINTVPHTHHRIWAVNLSGASAQNRDQNKKQIKNTCMFKDESRLQIYNLR